MTARIGECRSNSGALAVCLMAWRRGEADADAQAGAFAVAETMNMIRTVLTKKG